MKNALFALLCALVVAVVLTPVTRVLATRRGMIGRGRAPGSTPRLGGPAICAAFFVAVSALYLAPAGLRVPLLDAPGSSAHGVRLFGLLAGGAALCALGAVNDARGLRASHKLAVQVAVAVVAYACGFRMAGIHVPLLGDFDASAMALPLTVLWIVGIVNAINLIDGLDGLAAGIVIFAAGTNLVVAWLNGAFLVAWLSAAIAGAALGFLFYNFNPARIFMGDSGSSFLGYALAVTALIGTQKRSTAISLLVPVLALGVPIFDTLFAMVRRILERRSVFSPDRGHIHHRLLDMGVTHRRAVLVIYAASALFTAAAIGVSLETTWKVSVALFAASAALVGLVRFVGYFDHMAVRTRQQARLRPRDAELLRRAIPRLPRAFSGAGDEAELFQELWRFATEVELCFVEILGTAGGPEAPLQRWSLPAPPGAQDASARALVTASYPLGGDGVARSEVRFGWRCDLGEVPPEAEILLQIAVDLLAQNLGRLHSALSPATEPSLVSEPPDVLNIPARPSRI